jgi:hypothetical protein
VVLSPESVLRPTFSELKQMTRQQPTAAAARTLAEAEREHILDVLKQTDGLIGGMHGAASRLGLPRTTLVYKMRKLGIEARRLRRSRPVPQEREAGSPVFAMGGFAAFANVRRRQTGSEHRQMTSAPPRTGH